MKRVSCDFLPAVLLCETHSSWEHWGNSQSFVSPSVLVPRAHLQPDGVRVVDRDLHGRAARRRGGEAVHDVTDCRQHSALRTHNPESKPCADDEHGFSNGTWVTVCNSLSAAAGTLALGAADMVTRDTA